jgi:hypothetical protein
MNASRPKKPIRRFDVFAEYKRLEAEQDGMAEDEAMGYGLWVAKVVASRRFRRSEDRDRGRQPEREPGERPHTKFRSLDDEPQTDELFEKEIVDRMGRAFYRAEFAPAIAKAFKAGETYESIRDSIRKEWKPATARPAAR